MSVALVTGSHGFAGGHLCAELRSRGWRVVGLGRTPVPTTTSGSSTVDYRAVDLAEPAAVRVVLDEVRPDVVFHLAAITSLGGGRTVEDLVFETAGMARGLLLALRSAGRSVRVVNAGSSAQYGAVPRERNPVTEETRSGALSGYGEAKAQAEAVLRELAPDFEVIPVRAFNHIGPRESLTTVAGAFAERIRAVLAGQAERVNVGGLDSVRDFTDVRDIARGYAELAERGVPGRVYNLCSGRPTMVGDVLDGLLAAAGLDRSVVEVAPTPPAARSGQIAYQVGSPDRVRNEIGWTATIGLDQSTKDLLAMESG